MLREEAAAMIARHAPSVTPCHEDWVALDIDVSPLDNSGTKKEGVARTYHGNDGYAPIFAYLADGYLIHCQLREGSQHCQEGTPQVLQESIGYARQITPAKLLVRMDAGNDNVENMRRCQKEKVDWIIKRNLSMARASSTIRRSSPTWTWSGCRAGSSPPTPWCCRWAWWPATCCGYAGRRR
jgi:hypothetical protein